MDKWLVLEGDWGGQIYLTVPLAWVQATEQEIRDLLCAVDAACWACNRGEGAAAYVHQGNAGDGIPGGMGGGIVLNGLWLTEELAGIPASDLPGYHTPADQIPADEWLSRITAGLKLNSSQPQLPVFIGDNFP